MTPDFPIRQLRFTGIDFESAGAARGRTDVPVQIGLARWSVGHGHREPFASYLGSSHPITWAARKVHGIRNEDLTGAPSLLTLWPTVRRYLDGSVIVAHGHGTEKRFLRAFPGHGFGPWIDTLHLARAAWPESPQHGLSALCTACGLEPALRTMFPDRKWHDALFDSVASLALLERIIHTFDLADQPLSVLSSPDTNRWQRLRPG